MDFDPFTRVRMLEFQIGSMESQLVDLGSRSIEAIADNRNSQSLGVIGVQSELMGSTRQGRKFNTTLPVFITDFAP